MIRRTLRLIYVVLAWGYVVAVPVQVYFAGLGVFRVSLGFISGRPGGGTYYATHITFGYLLGLIALGMLIIAPIAGFKRRTIGWAGLLFLLNLAQTLLLWTGGGTVRALHPANGILIFATTLWLAGSATQEYRQATQGLVDRDSKGAAAPESAQAPGTSG